MQATALGSYLFYGRDRDFMAADALNVVAPADGATPEADWRVDANPDGTFAITLPSKGKALAVAAGRLVLADNAGAFSFEPADGCAVYPEVDTSATGSALHEQDAVGPGEGDHRPPPAHDGLRVPRRDARTAVGRGIPTARRTRSWTVPTTRSATAAARCWRTPSTATRSRCHDPVGWPTFKDWPQPRVADPRADLLQVGRARLHGRPAGDREPVRREQGSSASSIPSRGTTATR